MTETLPETTSMRASQSPELETGLWDVDAPSRLARARAQAPSAVSVFLIVFGILGFMGLEPANRTGDGGEYMVMAHGILDGHLGFDSAERSEADQWRDGLGLDFSAGELEMPKLQDEHGVQQWPHFWMYPLMASPTVAIASAIGVSPTWGFVVLNLMLFLLALALALPELGKWGAAALFASPVLWWMNKVHTEVFTFALLTIAFVSVRRRPWLSFVALGLASTQNVPIALAMPPFAIATLLIDRGNLKRASWWIGGAVGAALALLHPLYYQARLGVNTPQELNGGAIPGWWQGWEKTMAPVVDLNIGMLPGFPTAALLIVVALGIVLRRSGRLTARSIWPELALSLVVSVIFLIAFAKTGNLNSGGTPGITRYAVWLIPAMIPLFKLVRFRPRAQYVLPAAAILSASIAIAHYDPAQGESYTDPTAIATFIWDHQPELYTPHPEIFAERTLHAEKIEPTATENCAIVLMIAGEIPDRCTGWITGDIGGGCDMEQFCYAIRDGDRYRFEVLHPR